MSELNIQYWSLELQKYLKTEGCLGIFLNSMRIFKQKKTVTRPKTNKALVQVSFNNLYEKKRGGGNEKEAITVMATFNTAEQVILGMIVYPLKKISH